MIRLYAVTIYIISVCAAFGNEIRVEQSGCLDGEDTPPAIVVEVRDCILFVEQRGVVINCCLEYAPEVRVNDFDIEIVDRDVGPPCDCLCEQNLAIVISGLMAGDYTLTFDSFLERDPLVWTVTVAECRPGLSAPQIWSHPGILSVEVPVLATHSGGLEAFSFGATFPLEHCEISAIDLVGSVTAEVGAESVIVDIHTDPDAQGWATCSVVLDAEPPFSGQTIPGGADQPIARMLYDLFLPGDNVPRSISVPFVPGRGPEPVPLEFVVAGVATEPMCTDGIIQIRMPMPEFLRGDANSDDGVDISDAIFALNYLFLGGPEPACQDATDSDDDGELSITDAIRVLTYLFLEGTIPPPGPEVPGSDPTLDPLDCLIDAR